MDDDGLCTPWPRFEPCSPLNFLTDLPEEFATLLHNSIGYNLDPYRYIHIYTDGSADKFDGDTRSSWAFCVFAAHYDRPTDQQLCYVDWYGAITQEDPLHHHWCGAEIHSGRAGEAEAITWAILWCLQSGLSKDVIIHTDATSVLYAAMGDWNYATADQLMRRTRALYHLLWTIMGDHLPGRHVPAHSRHSRNKLADSLAKQVCRQLTIPRVPEVSLPY